MSEKIICNRCNGKGILGKVKLIASPYPYKILCPKCLGNRTVDWIENITGIGYKKITDAIIKMPDTTIPDNYLVKIETIVWTITGFTKNGTNISGSFLITISKIPELESKLNGGCS